VAISTRVREESGFGLVELLIAMTVMVVGITALVAAMSSGFIVVKRAADESTAAAVADKQMEAYRALPNCAIYLDSSTIPASGAYKAEPGLGSATQIVALASLTPPLKSSASPCPTPPATTKNAHQQLDGADGRPYWVDTYIVEATPATGSVTRKITLIVRDPKDATNTRALIRETATFAPPTGCTNPPAQQPKGC
jgi:type II secretory pathway pseudopilin PulG